MDGTHFIGLVQPVSPSRVLRGQDVHLEHVHPEDDAVDYGGTRALIEKTL